MNNSEHINLSDLMALERPYDKRPLFKISWKMTNMCPYSCSYCYMSKAVAKAKAEHDSPSQEKVEEIASHFDEMLDKLASPRDSVQMHLIGGEPSIYDLAAVIARVRRVDYLNFATNLYRPYEYWEKLFSYCKSRGIHYGASASFHLEALDTEAKREEYAEKVIGLKVQCKAVVNDRNIDIYEPYLRRFMKNMNSIEITIERDGKNACTALSPMHQKFVDEVREYQFARKERNSKDYLPYYTATMRNGRKIGYSSNIAFINSLNEGGFDTTGFWCNAGMHNVRIEKDGSMKRSACRLCSMYFKMGNVCDINSYEKPKGEIICKTTEAGKDHKYQTKYCTCFNNISMHRLGYDRRTGIYNPDHGIEIPDYHMMTYGPVPEEARK